MYPSLVGEDRQKSAIFEDVVPKFTRFLGKSGGAAPIESTNFEFFQGSLYIALPPYSPFAYASKGLRYAEKCACTVALGSMEYWRSAPGRKYMHANMRAIQRGVRITRIFVQYPDELRQHRDIISQMLQMGVSLYAVSPDEIPSELKRDMNILDKKILVHLELTNDGNIREDIITIDPVKVKRALDDFEKLKGFAVRIETMD